MLVLRRSDGQWIEITHRSGDVMRFRVYDLHRSAPGQCHLAFDDPARNFTIQRPERLATRTAPTAAEGEP
jgi:DNA-binding IclR family transcriptional regulator